MWSFQIIILDIVSWSLHWEAMTVSAVTTKTIGSYCKNTIFRSFLDVACPMHLNLEFSSRILSLSFSRDMFFKAGHFTFIAALDTAQNIIFDLVHINVGHLFWRNAGWQFWLVVVKIYVSAKTSFCNSFQWFCLAYLSSRLTDFLPSDSHESAKS